MFKTDHTMFDNKRPSKNKIPNPRFYHRDSINEDETAENERSWKQECQVVIFMRQEKMINTLRKQYLMAISKAVKQTRSYTIEQCGS